ncbi:MAG: hypothetical protein ACXWIH_01225 [Burkholderiales bacterium]
MLKTIRLINPEHDARHVARLNATLANASLYYGIHRVDRLAAFNSEMMSENYDFVTSDFYLSDIDGAKVLGHDRDITLRYSLLSGGDALTHENSAANLRPDAAECVSALGMLVS